jgi:predicted kinase
MRRSRSGTSGILKLDSPTLFIFGGLPATGKSTLAAALAFRLRAAYIRIDTIEQALRNSGSVLTGPEGYLIGYAMARENLTLGCHVVSDSVNSLHITRQAWRRVAEESASTFVEIEVLCSDKVEHRLRVESRSSNIDNLVLPSWTDVIERPYDQWESPRIQIDTAGQSVDRSISALFQNLSYYMEEK